RRASPAHQVFYRTGPTANRACRFYSWSSLASWRMKAPTAFSTSRASSESYFFSIWMLGLRHASLTALRLAVASLKNWFFVAHSGERLSYGFSSSLLHLLRIFSHDGFVLGSRVGSFNALPRTLRPHSTTCIK